MKLFSDCSGECKDCLCYYIRSCIAGHGDDDFNEITEDQASSLIKNKYYVNDDILLELYEKFPKLRRTK